MKNNYVFLFVFFVGSMHGQQSLPAKLSDITSNAQPQDILAVAQENGDAKKDVDEPIINGYQLLRVTASSSLDRTKEAMNEFGGAIDNLIEHRNNVTYYNELNTLLLPTLDNEAFKLTTLHVLIHDVIDDKCQEKKLVDLAYLPWRQLPVKIVKDLPFNVAACAVNNILKRNMPDRPFTVAMTTVAVNATTAVITYHVAPCPWEWQKAQELPSKIAGDLPRALITSVATAGVIYVFDVDKHVDTVVDYGLQKCGIQKPRDDGWHEWLLTNGKALLKQQVAALILGLYAEPLYDRASGVLRSSSSS
ncbi:MAG: hypothetical protein NTX86_04880 [Candidatus Dependentiae bacterium]|nr:hypothetical protein [Candidatus Dependentiae bacterium]